MKRFQSVSFLGKYRTSAKSNGLRTSKKYDGIILCALHFSMKRLMALFTNLGGQSAFRNFCLIVGISSVKELAIRAAV